MILKTLTHKDKKNKKENNQEGKQKIPTELQEATVVAEVYKRKKRVTAEGKYSKDSGTNTLKVIEDEK